MKTEPRDTAGRPPFATRWLAVAIVGIAVLGIGLGTTLARSASGGSGAAAKAQLDARQREALITAQANPRPKLVALAPPPATQPVPTRQAGIVAARQGPFPRASFDVRNVWQGPVGSTWLVVYAGAVPTSPGATASQGAVRVYQEGSDLHLTLIGTYPAAAGVGPLTITGKAGTTLSLRSDSGATLSVDLTSDQFASP
jgi:hypothetical protein